MQRMTLPLLAVPPNPPRAWLRSGIMADLGSSSRRDFLRLAGMAGTALAVGSAWGCAPTTASQNLSFSVEQIPYGTEPMQMGELNVPLLGKPRPVVVLLHGGYWQTGFDR